MWGGYDACETLTTNYALVLGFNLTPELTEWDYGAVFRGIAKEHSIRHCL
ncbi:hypothetical protein CEV33_1179 [Brucella grignonensis]|uniref:Uncharacterized protein n=1 Tax=Brucella grignonensis TaxID=94627 RepID=A0A256FC00_9HYPH|nr:hypothetical protein CEV33_1179 [Brucella grignonensis]